MYRAISLLILASCVTLTANALIIDSDRLLGYREGKGGGSKSSELEYLYLLLDRYNETTDELPKGFTLAPGTLVPLAPLDRPSDSFDGGGDGGSSMEISVGAFNWLSLKTGKFTGLYYIGDLSLGTHTLANDLFKNGKSKHYGDISHYNFFGERDSDEHANVSDSGPTAALLIVSIIGITFFRYRFARA